MDARAALRLQVEWGADEALDEAAVDRLRPAAVPPPRPGPLRGPGPVPPGEGEQAQSRATAVERAMQAAGAARSLEELRAAIAGFAGCALRDTASHTVFAAGDPAGGLLVIGDPPGPEEDRSGAPFAGPAGAYLDRMLASIGLAREAILLAHLLPWRPPGDRPPNAAELAICLPFLHRLIALAAPRRLVLCGLLTARTLLAPGSGRRRPRGEWIEAAIPGAGTLPALPTFSPAELMRGPKDRRAAWADLRLLRRTLDGDAAAA